MKFLVLIVILSMAINGTVEARAGSDWLHYLPKGLVPSSGPSHGSPPPPRRAREEFHYLPKGSCGIELQWQPFLVARSQGRFPGSMENMGVRDQSASLTQKSNPNSHAGGLSENMVQGISPNPVAPVAVTQAGSFGSFFSMPFADPNNKNISSMADQTIDPVGGVVPVPHVFPRLGGGVFSESMPLVEVGGRLLSGDDRVAVNPVRHSINLEKFLGFPTLENDASRNGNSKDCVGESGSHAATGGRSFAQVAGGMPDLSSLPDPVVSGGVTRVVLPQVTRLIIRVILLTKREGVSSDGVNNVTIPVSNPIGRWADAVDEDGSEEEGELVPTPLLVDVSQLVNVSPNVQVSGRMEGMPEEVANYMETQQIMGQPIANEIVQDDRQVIPTVTSSLGGTASLGGNGQVVIFQDIAAIEGELNELGGEYTNVEKHPPGRPPGRGSK
ncbi:hypothetical protein NE237_009149 [Protea cynaroides]|uniref:Uncharacterized protein n=1 Tax=Protea cynaroides TaxID=273540 RepID=A0A9Q0KY06_9MAGN|nr:hypothetical protein NE237_009149 [Protea cynaroides]